MRLVACRRSATDFAAGAIGIQGWLPARFLPPIDVRRSSIEDSQTATERAVKEAGYLKNDSGDRTKRESPQVSDEALYMTDLPTILGNRLVLAPWNNPA